MPREVGAGRGVPKRTYARTHTQEDNTVSTKLENLMAEFVKSQDARMSAIEAKLAERPNSGKAPAGKRAEDGPTGLDVTRVAGYEQATHGATVKLDTWAQGGRVTRIRQYAGLEPRTELMPNGQPYTPAVVEANRKFATNVAACFDAKGALKASAPRIKTTKVSA